ncbi:MAG: hypothetical protein Q7R39_02215 [Dehalococcoidia bacterium]|nr:hypothetical protein [Dehalococcoidia bacterium]
MAGLACPMCGTSISAEAGVGGYSCSNCSTEVDVAHNPTRIVGQRIKVRNPATVRIASRRKVRVRRRNPEAECPSCGKVQEIPPGVSKGFCAGCHTEVEVPEHARNPSQQRQRKSTVIPLLITAKSTRRKQGARRAN